MAARDESAAPLLCEGITKRYDGQPVLSSVGLEIPAGAVLGLIGRNGAGKTTLIRILLGLLSPDAGMAYVFGEPALNLRDGAMMRLGYVPQQPDMLAWMRVGEMLEFVGAQYPKWDRAFVRHELERCGLDPKRRLTALSPGEHQRVALIRALAATPELLVLDEPAAALDPVARRDLLREIALRAGESGTTVLFSTHIVPDLERVASHVAFLHNGSFVLSSPMDELAERYGRLVVPAAAVPVAADPLPGELSRRRRSDGTLAVVVARSPGAAWPLVGTAPQARVDALGLEDLFIEVTQ
ncbi:MAG TPA: ABC transporter ATP-binding protein [Steroidobacteraceae bacterium]|nr:ABC transporter ATP-binding protein [Steroidobacteraceae bacterium]